MHTSIQERWNSISLRTKITGVTVLMLTLGLLVSGVGTLAMLKPYLISQIDSELRSLQESAAQGNISPLITSTITQESSASDQTYIAIVEGDGQVIADNWSSLPKGEGPEIPTGLTTSAVLKQGTRVFNVRNANGTLDFRAMVAPFQQTVPNGTYGTLFVAIPTANVENAVATYMSIFLGFGIIVVIAGAGLTRMLVTTTFAPLRQVEQTAAEIAEGDFGQRLGDATPKTEVGRLNRSLNTMLNRIDRAFDDRAKTIEQMRRFVGDASHELRTPLVSVRGYAELYRMGALQSPDEVAQAMDRIEKEAIRMGGLVEDLLELARLDETKPLQLARVDLIPLARDAAMDAMASSPRRVVSVLVPPPISSETGATGPEAGGRERVGLGTAGMSPSAAGPGSTQVGGAAPTKSPDGGLTPTGPIAFAGATLARLRSRRPRRPGGSTGEVPVLPGVPAVPTDRQEFGASPILPEHTEAEPAFVMAEENKIRQVVTNLMGNAMRFTAEDSPIEIRVQLDHRIERVSLEIIDHGEGIPPQIREKIFQRFWRADTSRARETGGSGLGLAIVSSIVAAHNGTVDVVDTPGGGATFRVSLPLADSPEAPRPLDA